MKNNTQHNNTGLPEDFDNFLKKADIPYSKSKQEAWEEMSAKIAGNRAQKTRVIGTNRTFYLAAAIISLLLVTSLTARFYTKTFTSSTGEHTSCLLPDGSEVMLNAETTLKYRPIWWKIKREVNMKGEAFFEVKKGEKFSVISENGITSVLGTSFNIYARGQEYEVTCVTGKVKVRSVDGNVSKTILPNEKAIVNTSGGIVVKTGFDVRESTSWKANMHFFKGSLENVVEEIERQYNVDIKISAEIKGGITIELNSPNEKNVENMLKNICGVSDLTFEKTGKKVYIIKKKQP